MKKVQKLRQIRMYKKAPLDKWALCYLLIPHILELHNEEEAFPPYSFLFEVLPLLSGQSPVKKREEEDGKKES